MIDLSKIKTIAVVGASNNPAKYGNKIVKNLKGRGFGVFPINPKEVEIEGLKVYSSLSEVPERPNLAVFVVPAEIGINLVREAVKLGIENIWVQPGAESEEIERYLNEHTEVNSIIESCIMVN